MTPLIPRLLATSIFVLIVSTFARCGCAEPVQFYVSQDGNDTWSGRLAKPNATKTDGPLATLVRVRDVVREHRRENQLPEGAIVEFGAGTYTLEATLELTSEDSGTKEAPAKFRAAAGNRYGYLVAKLCVTGTASTTPQS